ncbi:MAG: hypothetical protein JST54_21520 [Deltaproteobacteria bacterium]|nr:hypothetical protein [Deltaproteobacteria bacterium]
MRRALAIAALALLAWACASAPANEELRPVQAPEPPSHSADLHRPGGPLDVKPTTSWAEADGGPTVWPMSQSAGETPPAESAMPGALSPH